MMNGNCRNNFQQQPPCRLGMFKPANFFSPITTSVGNWIQNTANLFLDPHACAPQKQQKRQFGTSANRYSSPSGAFINITPYATAFINIDNFVVDPMACKTSAPHQQNDKKYEFNQYTDGVGHRVGHGSYNKNSTKSGCDFNANNSHSNYNRYGRNQNMNTKDYHRARKNDHNRQGYRVSEKQRSTLNELSEQSCRPNNSSNNNSHIISRPNSSSRNTDVQQNSSTCNNRNNNNNGSRPPEVVAIFTLDDFPELPVPKRREPWSLTFPGTCKALVNSKNNIRTSPTIKAKPAHGKNVQSSKAQDKNCVRNLDISDHLEDNFVIIMDNRASPKFNASTRSTAGFTPFKPRQRQISECSDDSFIFFTNDVADGEIEFTDVCVDDDDDSDSDESDSSDDSDDDDDDCNSNVVVNMCKTKTNVPRSKTENIKNCLNNNLEALSAESTSQPDSGFDDVKDKKVRFNMKPEIHVMHTWDYAYRAARKGDWESYARDRCRFKDRTENISRTLSAVFDNKHREKIYRERFSNPPI